MFVKEQFKLAVPGLDDTTVVDVLSEEKMPDSIASDSDSGILPVSGVESHGVVSDTDFPEYNPRAPEEMANS